MMCVIMFYFLMLYLLLHLFANMMLETFITYRYIMFVMFVVNLILLFILEDKSFQKRHVGWISSHLDGNIYFLFKLMKLMNTLSMQKLVLRYKDRPYEPD